MEAKTQTIRELLLRVFPEGTNREFPSEASGKTNTELRLAEVPKWAPDLFAAMAILIEQSGCYTHPKFIQQHPPADGDPSELSKKQSQRLKEIKEVAKEYCYCWLFDKRKLTALHEANDKEIDSKRSYEMIQQIQQRWQELVVNHGDKSIGEIGTLRNDLPPSWCENAMWLFEVADEACEGAGFVSDLHGARPSDNPVAIHVCHSQQMAYRKEHLERIHRIANIEKIEDDYDEVMAALTEGVKPLEERIEKQEFTKLQYLPYSICYAVPSYIACVQPKANTPQVGYSLRSFSHNLALLPQVGEVTTYWFNAFSPLPDDDDNRLNLLLIPYPYSIAASCFAPINLNNSEHNYIFGVRQKWLDALLTVDEEDDLLEYPEKDEKVSYTGTRKWQRAKKQGEKISAAIHQLIKEAGKDAGTIHGVILPELALNYDVAECASGGLFEKHRELQFFISGVIAERQVNQGGPRLINSVFTRLNIHWPIAPNPDGKKMVALRRVQVKHHRWMLDKNQIIRYNLGAQLNPESKWLEDTDMIERESLFWVFRPYMVIASLVCEDMARIDPVQRVLRAVAPNLVIALLLDGPQITTRWACRYATGLSDDPGCGVLTLTSLGMIRRDNLAKGQPDHIAIWKDSEGQTMELILPPGAAALTVTLNVRKVREMVAGGRAQSEENWSRKLYLSAVHPVLPPRTKSVDGKTNDRFMFDQI